MQLLLLLRAVMRKKRIVTIKMLQYRKLTIIRRHGMNSASISTGRERNFTHKSMQQTSEFYFLMMVMTRIRSKKFE